MNHVIPFNDAFMGSGDPLVTSAVPGFGSGNRTPGTSRVGTKAARSARSAKPVRKGLSKACVAVNNIDPRTAEVRVKGTLHILGYIRMSQGKAGKAYSYKIVGERRAHNGFSSRAAALARMLEKC